MVERSQSDRDQIIGFTCSAFDLMHAGHVEFLRECRERCDRLVVGLQTQIQDRPGKNQPVQSVLERFLVLRACKYVDEIIPYESEADLTNLIAVLGPHHRFLGSDYALREDSITGNLWYMDPGYELVFIPRAHQFSTSTLRARIFIAESMRLDNERINKRKTGGDSYDDSSVAEGSDPTPGYH